MAQIASKTCEICVSAPGQYHCQQCEQLFCNNCKVGHLRSKLAKDHTFVTGGEINKDVKLNCGQHKELFIYQCMQCKTQICRICAVKSHKGHDISDLSEYTENLRQNVITVVENKMRNLNLNANHIEKGISQYRQEVKTAIQAITEEGNKLKLLIDRKVDELIQQVKQHESGQMKLLINRQNDLKRDIDNVNKYKQQLETFQKGSHDETLHQQMNQLKLDVEALTEQLLTMPTLSYQPKQRNEDDISKLFGLLDMRNMSKSADEKSPLQQNPTKQSGKYLYRCHVCSTEQRSDEEPYYFRIGLGLYSYCGEYGVFRDCKKCGKRTWHDYIQEKR